MTSSETGHNYSYDLLRIIAILCVIFNHTKQYGYELYTVATDPYSRYGSLLLAIICKIGVPLFLMVSGALLLGKEESVQTVLKKRVLPFAVIFAGMFFLQYLRVARAGGYDGVSISGYLRCLLYDDPIAPYWFLRSYLIFLITLPLLRAIARQMNRDWFILLIVLQCITTVLDMTAAFTGGANAFSFFPVDAFLFYPLAGYYLSAHREETKRYLQISAVISAVVLIATVVLLNQHVMQGTAESLFGPVWLYAITIFLLVTAHSFTSNHPILKEAGSCVFGVYLIEDIVRNRLEFLIFLFEKVIGTLPACLLFVIIVFLVSAAVVWIGRRIPGIRFFLH